ncbi:hypothetical protein P9112_014128 [Eukaryota sp. TZLM1-RC]
MSSLLSSLNVSALIQNSCTLMLAIDTYHNQVVDYSPPLLKLLKYTDPGLRGTQLSNIVYHVDLVVLDYIIEHQQLSFVLRMRTRHEKLVYIRWQVIWSALTVMVCSGVNISKDIASLQHPLEEPITLSPCKALLWLDLSSWTIAQCQNCWSEVLPLDVDTSWDVISSIFLAPPADEVMGHISTVRDQKSPASFRCVIRSPKDSSIFASCVGLGPHFDGEGNVDSIMVSITEITTTERVVDLFQTLLNLTNDGLLVFENSQLILWNKKLVRDHDDSTIPLFEEHSLRVGAPMNCIIAEMTRFCEPGEASSPVILDKKHYNLFCLDRYLEVIRLDHHRHTSITLMIFRDVTASRKTEQELEASKRTAEQADRAKTLFLASTSHEIRTPLTCIIGLSSALKETELDPSQQEMVTIIENSSNVLLSLINDILDYSKIESASIELDRSSFYLSSLMDECISLFRSSALSTKTIDCLYFFDTTLHRKFIGDPQRIKQIILNLLSNAIKFTSQGHVSLDVRDIEENVDSCSKIRISVSDTGIGIEKDVIKTLFKPFVQGSAEVSRTYKGTGLGLAISQKLANLMDAKVKVDSRPNVGSTFWVDLPLEKDLGSIFEPFPTRYSTHTVMVHNTSQKIAESIEKQLKSFGSKTITWTIDSMNQIERLGVTILIMDYSDSTAIEWYMQNNAKISKDCHCVLTFNPAIRGSVNSGIRATFCATFALPLLFSEVLRILDISSGLALPEIAKRKSQETLQPPKNGEKYKILLADDNAINRKTAIIIFERLGAVDLTTVDDGSKVLELYTKDPLKWDLLLIDYRMHTPGDVTTHSLRNFENHHRIEAVPIVGLTADVLEETKKQCLNAGMTGFLLKPFTKTQMLDTLTKSLPEESGRRQKGATRKQSVY